MIYLAWRVSIEVFSEILWKNPTHPTPKPVTPSRGGGGKQKDKPDFIFPEPSLWNSALGRRAFLKKTGAASVGTALALHGFKTEVMASDSIKLRKKKTYKQSAEGKGFNTSFNTAKIEARGDAVTKVGSAAEDLESEEWVEAAPDDYWIPEIGWNEAYNPEDDTGLVAPYSVTCTLSKEHIVIA